MHTNQKINMTTYLNCLKIINKLKWMYKKNIKYLMWSFLRTQKCLYLPNMNQKHKTNKQTHKSIQSLQSKYHKKTVGFTHCYT